MSFTVIVFRKNVPVRNGVGGSVQAIVLWTFHGKTRLNGKDKNAKENGSAPNLKRIVSVKGATPFSL